MSALRWQRKEKSQLPYILDRYDMHYLTQMVVRVRFGRNEFWIWTTLCRRWQSTFRGRRRDRGRVGPGRIRRCCALVRNRGELLSHPFAQSRDGLATNYCQLHDGCRIVSGLLKSEFLIFYPYQLAICFPISLPQTLNHIYIYGWMIHKFHRNFKLYTQTNASEKKIGK